MRRRRPWWRPLRAPKASPARPRPARSRSGEAATNVVTETYPLPLVPCAILMHRDPTTGLWLAISRGSDLADWGFPGGKTEGDEMPPETAIRECREETLVEAFDLEFVYVDAVPSGRRCYAFASMRVRLPKTLPASREGTVAWRPESDLVASTSSYAAYNRAAFSAYYERIPYSCS